MPRAQTAEARTERNRAIRADRARGLTLRQIAQVHGISTNQAHRVARHVNIVTPNRWHRARTPKEAPAPALVGHLHLLLSR